MTDITISIGLNIQEVYEQARAMAACFRSQLFTTDEGEEGIDLSETRGKARALAEAWDAAATSLERSGQICIHPGPRQIHVDQAMNICLECERAVPRAVYG